MEFLGMLIIAGLIGWLTQYMGKKKNIENCFWWGFFLGWIGIIVVACKSPRDEFGRKIKH